MDFGGTHTFSPFTMPTFIKSLLFGCDNAKRLLQAFTTTQWCGFYEGGYIPCTESHITDDKTGINTWAEHWPTPSPHA